MPNIDFTLEDFKAVIHQETPRIIEQALIKEREHTQHMVHNMMQKMINESAADIKQSIAGEFLNFWEFNLAPTLDELRDDIRELKGHPQRTSRG